MYVAMATDVHMDYITFKTGYLISNAFVNTGLAYAGYLCSLCNCKHIKFTEACRLGPRVKKFKNGYPKSSKDSYSINLKKYIWCIRNHCIASFWVLHNATRAKKYGGPCASYACMRLIQTLLSQQRVIKLKSNYLSGMTMF